jgi:PAS domain S-box-containing protein
MSSTRESQPGRAGDLGTAGRGAARSKPVGERERAAPRDQCLGLSRIAPVAYFTLDHSGLIQRANIPGANLLGVERKALAGAELVGFVAAPAVDAFRAHLRQMFDQGPSTTCEIELARVDGTPFHARLECVRVRDSGSAGTRCWIAMSDITDCQRAERAFQRAPVELEGREHRRMAALAEANARLRREIAERKRAEEQLRRERDNWIRILDAMEDGVYIADRKYNLEYVNPALKREFGSSTGRKCYEYLRDRGEVCPNCRNRDVFEGSTVRWERYSPKTRKTYDLIATPLRNPDGTLSKLEIVRDITAQKRAEEKRRELETRLQRGQKLESLGVLAGGIAHEFNNLLVGVLGNASLALEGLSEDAPAARLIRRVEHAAQRAADLTRQMLAFSGKGRFVVRPVGLSRLVREMAELLEASVSKKVTLAYDLREHLTPVEADPSQLRQVIVNLVTNATEAIGEQSGTITIRTGEMEADDAYLAACYLDDQLPSGRYVFVEVIDTGAGMDEEVRAKIFDPFFSTKFTGRGMGLAAVLGIVRGHHGAVNVRSQPGQGTVFRVVFPTFDASLENANAPRHPDAPAHARGTVLVVDDEEAVRTVARTVLEHRGFTVLTANDGREAIKVYRAHGDAIDVVLLDLMMPHLSGEEVFRELFNLNANARVILSSGYDEQDVTARFAGMGLAGFIQKPYRPAALIEAVTRARKAGH